MRMPIRRGAQMSRTRYDDSITLRLDREMNANLKALAANRHVCRAELIRAMLTDSIAEPPEGTNGPPEMCSAPSDLLIQLAHTDLLPECVRDGILTGLLPPLSELALYLSIGLMDANA